MGGRGGRRAVPTLGRVETLTERRSWLARHPRRVDAAIAVGLWLLLAVTTLVALADPPGEDLAQAAVVFALSSVMTLVLAVRRTHPEVTLAVVVGVHLVQLAATDQLWPANLTAPLTAYTIAAWGERTWWRRAGLAAAVVSGPAAAVVWPSQPSSVSAQVFSATLTSALPCLCWLWGDLTRRRRELLARLREQNEALRRDRDQRARIAAQDERTRIAREMHDVVAHSLAVVVVQADGASYAATHSPAWQREQATAALETIAGTARGALAETRRLVGVLRAADDDARRDGAGDGGDRGDGGVGGYAPTDSLADLPALVGRVRDSGVDVRLDAPPEAELEAVPRDVGLAALRVVQESLTNVIKHAGPRVDAVVRVSAGTGGVSVLVEDDGRGASASDDGMGHGLVGMRERAAAVGGTLTAGPRPGGGYRVAAHLPSSPDADG